MAKASEPYQIIVNEQLKLAIEPQEAAALDLIPLPTGGFHILKGGKKYVAEVIDAHYAERAFTIRVNGSVFKVHIADKYERLIQEMGLTIGASQKMNEIKAPMPGLVLDILVTEGQSVKKGDALLILEAMKMENVIKAAGDAVVKAVLVKKGVPVDKGNLLMRFE
jgi:biotin carboxyl carrier protein